jgi:hypothetical protein
VAEQYKDDMKLDMFLESSARTGFNAKNVIFFITRNRFS